MEAVTNSHFDGLVDLSKMQFLHPQKSHRLSIKKVANNTHICHTPHELIMRVIKSLGATGGRHVMRSAMAT